MDYLYLCSSLSSSCVPPEAAKGAKRNVCDTNVKCPLQGEWQLSLVILVLGFTIWRCRNKLICDWSLSMSQKKWTHLHS